MASTARLADGAKKVVEKLSPRRFLDNIAELMAEYNILSFMIGTVMGVAVTDFVKALSTDIISPLLFSLLGPKWKGYSVEVLGADLALGAFINTVIQVGLIVSLLIAILSTLFSYDVQTKRLEKQQKQLEEQRQKLWQDSVLRTLEEIAEAGKMSTP